MKKKGSATIWAGRISMRKEFRVSRNGSICNLCNKEIKKGDLYAFYDFWPKYNPRLFETRCDDICPHCINKPYLISSIADVGYKIEQKKQKNPEVLVPNPIRFKKYEK